MSAFVCRKTHKKKHKTFKNFNLNWNKREEVDHETRRVLFNKVYAREHGRCFYCQTEVTRDRNLDGSPLMNCGTLEHLVPVAYGGNYDLRNLVLGCHLCNQRRGRKNIEVFLILYGLYADNINRIRKHLDNVGYDLSKSRKR